MTSGRKTRLVIRERWSTGRKPGVGSSRSVEVCNDQESYWNRQISSGRFSCR